MKQNKCEKKIKTKQNLHHFRASIIFDSLTNSHFRGFHVSRHFSFAFKNYDSFVKFRKQISIEAMHFAY